MIDTHSCDVLVIGAGPAGMAAACAAAERGKRVIVLDIGLRPGGQIWRHRDEATLPVIARQLLERLGSLAILIHQGARVLDAPSAREIYAEIDGRSLCYRTASLIVCTGARERFLPFPGWTLPGVTGVGGFQALLKSGLQPGDARVILAGSGPLLLPVAALTAKSGCRLSLVAEQASFGKVTAFASRVLTDPTRLKQAIHYRRAFLSTPFRTGTWIRAAFGNQRLSEVELTNGTRTWTAPCEWLGTSMGLVPNTEVAQLLGCALQSEAIAVDETQRTSHQDVWAAGECTGVKGEFAALNEGEIAGAAAAGDTAAATVPRRQQQRIAGIRFGAQLTATFSLRPEILALATDDTIICRCEDVARRSLDPAWTQRQAKLWTRVGMGACQGAVCGPACAALFGWTTNRVQPPLNAPELGTWIESRE